MRVVAIVLVAGAVAGAALPSPGAAAGGKYLTSQFRWQAEGGVEGGAAAPRHSVDAQGDDDATVATDTLVVPDGKPAADALQVKVRLMSARPDAVPSLRLAAVAVSTAPPKQPAGGAGDPARWGRGPHVPARTPSHPHRGGGRGSPPPISTILGHLGPRTR